MTDPRDVDDPRPPGSGPVAGWRQGWTALLLTSLARSVLAAVVVLVAWSVVPVPFGAQSHVVLTGSMAPRLEVGDVVVSRDVPVPTLAVGDVVVAADPDRPGGVRVHRLAGWEDGRLRLRGDANPAPDSSLVSPADVVGVGVLRVPWIGAPRVWVSTGDWVPLTATGVGLVGLLAASSVFRPPGAGLPARAGSHRAPVRLTRRGRRVRAATVLGLLVGVTVTTHHAASAAYASTTGGGLSTLASAQHFRCAAAVADAGAGRYYPLQETDGPTAVNLGTDPDADATFHGGVALGSPGPDCLGADRAVTLDGSSGWIGTASPVSNPTVFSIGVWFRTTVAGGKIMGFGTSANATSGQYDRHVYMSDDGRLTFGVYNGAIQTITTPGSYADGAWHLAVGTLGPAGLGFYVDGARIGLRPEVTTAEQITGFWRLGFDTLGGWPGAPGNSYFTGSLAHAAVYPTQLGPDGVRELYVTGA